jgi:hypothetical protein
MIKDGDYIVLDKDNVEEIMELTGKTEKELRELYEECVIFGRVQVFWREFNLWWGVQVSGEYVHAGILDDVVKELMIKHRRRIDVSDTNVV